MPLDSASIEMKTVDEAAREAEEANGAVGLFAGAGAKKRYGVRTCGETAGLDGEARIHRWGAVRPSGKKKSILYPRTRSHHD